MDIQEAATSNRRQVYVMPALAWEAPLELVAVSF